MTTVHKILSLLVVFCVAGSSAQAATWTTIDFPGAVNTVAYGINSAGDVVGAYLDTASVVHGFLLSGGTFTAFDPPGSTETNANAINDTGQITGWFVTADRVTHGFFFDGGNFVRLDFPGSTLSTVSFGIDNADEVVGVYIDASDKGHGFKWSNGTYVTVDVVKHGSTVLLGVNNRGQIVGFYDLGEIFHTFVLDASGNVRRLNTLSTPYAINDKRIVVGGPDKSNRGFTFNLKTKVYSEISFPKAAVTTCVGINNNQQIVGYYQDSSGNIHGFLRTR